MFRKLCLSFVVLALLAFVWSPVVTAEGKLFDPVCSMEVAKDTPHATEYDGKKYTFCSADCKAEFAKDPKKYACYCLEPTDCPHCTGVSAQCPCDKVKHGHERCHGKHKGGE